MLPSPDILNEFEFGKFVLSNLAAKRAKQLREGAMPLVQVESNHPLTIALAEIAAGKIKAILPSPDAPTALDEAAVTVLVDDTMPGELGLLLPALDETEVALVTTALGEDEHEAEVDPEDPDALSLSDLVAEEDDDAAPAAASDEDTLSLTDIAEQESADETEEEQD